MAYNLGLWVNSLGFHGTPLWMKTLRHRFLALPDRLTRSARHFFGGPKAASACLALEKNPVAPVPPAPRTLHRTPSCVTANRPEQAMATICLREEHCEVSGGPAGGFGLR